MNELPRADRGQMSSKRKGGRDDEDPTDDSPRQIGSARDGHRHRRGGYGCCVDVAE